MHNIQLHAYQWMDNNNDNSMCPPSDNLHRRSSCTKQQMQQHKLFDTSRKFLHKTHKFITADLCIIVDGQNYESYRHATADKMKMINRSCNDLSKYYKPVSSRGSSGGSMKQSTSSATLSTAESSSYTTCDQLDASQRSVSPPHVLDWLRSASATAQKKQQQQQQDRIRNRVSSSQSSLPDLEAIRRRRASASGSSKQRRRHSIQEIDPARRSATRSRRLSGQSTSSESSTQPRVKLLHASKPMHRTLSNQDISGILRPARYSSTNLADMASGYESGAPSPLIRREINRISNDMKSLLGAASPHRLDFRSVSSLTRRSTTASTGQLQNKSRLQQQQAGRSLSRMNSKTNPIHDTRGKKNAEWVASGVNFSQNMEVFVFQKR